MALLNANKKRSWRLIGLELCRMKDAARTLQMHRCTVARTRLIKGCRHGGRDQGGGERGRKIDVTRLHHKKRKSEANGFLPCITAPFVPAKSREIPCTGQTFPSGASLQASLGPGRRKSRTSRNCGHLYADVFPKQTFFLPILRAAPEEKKTLLQGSGKDGRSWQRSVVHGARKKKFLFPGNASFPPLPR